MGSHQLTDPEDIAASTFGTSFRGYDPAEVRSYLAAVAKRLSSALERVDVLEQETRDLQVKAGASTESAPDPTDLTRWLGAETAKVLDAANAAAESQRARAVDEADELVTEARARAESIVEDAERNRSDVLDAATVEADSILTEAEAVRTSVQEHYDTELERARDEAERLIAEATAVRETMLVELADQRHEVRGQIEQLKAGRDALMGVLSNASTVVGGVFDDLEDAMPSARRVAEVAAHKVSRSPITVAEYDRYVVEVDLDESPTDSVARSVEPADLAAGTEAVAVGELDHEFGPPHERMGGDEAEDPGADIVTLYDQSQYDEAQRDNDEVDEAGSAANDGDESTEDSLEHGDGQESSEPRLTVVEALAADDEGPLDVLFERLRDDVPEASGDAPDEPGVSDETESSDSGAASDDSDETDGEPSPRDEREELIAELARALKNELSDEQNDLLDGLRQSDNEVLDYPGPQTQAERYRTVAATLAEPQADAIAEAIVSQLQRRVPAVLAETAADVEETSERVRSIYREVRTHRIDEAVRSALTGQLT